VSREGVRFGRGELVAIVLLLLVATAQRAWNAYAVPPLRGYDAPGHAGYVLTIVEEGRLPHPMEGWATFHPPLFYLLGSAAWWTFEPLGPHAVSFALRAIGAFAGIAGALVVYVLARRFGASPAVAWMATALFLFVPCNQMAAAMEGNEALAAGLSALVLPALVSLQINPGNLRAAATAGLLAGMALSTKYNSIALVPACLAPFAMRRPSPRTLLSLGVLAVAVGIVAGPFYARNLALTGSLIPMTRDLEPMRSIEASQVLRPREIGDYLWLSPEALRRPSLFHVAGKNGSLQNRNPAMTNVWGLTYASIWYDAFGHRIPLRFHGDRRRAGPAMTLLGLVPTTVMLLGFFAAASTVVRFGERAPYTPLVVLWIAGFALFVAFTWTAPSAAAVKGSYMLALAAPGAIFFARGAMLAGPRTRAILLSASAIAVVVAATIFTERLVFSADALGLKAWRVWAAQLPASHIAEATAWFLEPPRRSAEPSRLPRELR
jgi:hypothetical protein